MRLGEIPLRQKMHRGLRSKNLSHVTLDTRPSALPSWNRIKRGPGNEASNNLDVQKLVHILWLASFVYDTSLVIHTCTT